MKTMAILIGIQGSSKSTFCKTMLSDEYVRINLDTLKTRNREQQLLKDCISTDQNVVIGNTNPTKADRAR